MIILGKTNDEKLSKLGTDSKSVSSKYVSYDDKDRVLEENNSCVSDNNSTYDLFVKRDSNIKKFESRLSAYIDYIYSDDKKYLDDDRFSRICRVYLEFEKSGLSNHDCLKLLSRCLTFDDKFSIVECCAIEEEKGTTCALDSLGKTRR